jgi:hypothetical protein
MFALLSFRRSWWPKDVHSLFDLGYAAVMPSRSSAPNPSVNVLAVRAAALRSVCLYAKGVGERMVLKEAAAIFDSLCPGLPRAVAKCGRELAKATAKARKPLPGRGLVPMANPPRDLLAALARPAQPRDAPVPKLVPMMAPPAWETASAPSRRPSTPQAGMPTSPAIVGGHLRVILGGRSSADQRH